MKKFLSRLPWFLMLTAIVGAYLSLNVFAYIDPYVVIINVQTAADIVVTVATIVAPIIIAVVFFWRNKKKK